MSDEPVAVITGAAGGLGKALSRTFLEGGYRVVLVDVLEDDILQMAEMSGGSHYLPIAIDLADLEQVESIVPRTLEHWGRLDVLINNAAWRETIDLRRMTPESWNRTLAVCLTAPAFLSRWSAEAMQERGQGVIVNISSTMSRRASGIAPSYVAAKGGLDAITYELAVLLGRHGIRVFAVNPGAMETELSRGYRDAAGESLEKSVRQWSEDHIPLGRWADPAEIARLVFLLTRDDASYLHGTSVTVDGGWARAHFPHSLRERFLGSEDA